MEAHSISKPFLCTLLILCTLTYSSLLRAQTPGVSANINYCKRTINVEFAAWYSNFNGNDDEIDQLEVIVKQDGEELTIWTGNFHKQDHDDDCGHDDVSGSGDGGEDLHGGWDCDEYIRWSCPGIWYVYNYGPSRRWRNYSGGSIYDNSVLTPITTSGDSWVTYELEFGPIPDEWYDGSSLTIEVSGTFDDNEFSYIQSAPPVSFAAFPKPTGFKASNETSGGHCNKIDLTWTKPSSSCDYKYEIEYKLSSSSTWSVLTTIDNEDTEEYTHTGLNPGVEYDYRIQTILKPGIDIGSADELTSGFSDETTGSTLDRPGVPINVDATEGNCDQTVDVSWDFNIGGSSASLENFRIYRNNVVIATVGANDRSYQDEVPARGVVYNYKVEAKNECGWGTSSSTVQGVSPEDPTPPASVSTQIIAGTGIRINWPLGALATEYKIERNLLGGGGSTFLGPIANTETTYLDTSIVPCQTYEYRVIALNDCKPDGVPTSINASGKLVPDLSNTFTSNALIASKGFHSDRVELSWTVENNANIINAFKIYRRDLSTTDRTLIASLNSGSNLYVDNLVDAAKLYEYIIIAETQCENETVYSNEASAIGFRTPFGTVTGNVTYSGGTAVEDVKISAETTAQILGKSLQLDGASHLEITHNPNLNTTAELLLETWLYPNSYSADFSLIKHASVYDLKYNQASNQYQFEFLYNTSESRTISIDASQLALNNYNHIAAQIYQDTAKIFLNGEVVAQEYISSGIDLNDNVAPITIGNNYKGLLTDIRIWNKGKSDEQVKRDFSRFLIGGETGLKVYLKTNEGLGGYAYDSSKSNGVYNRNHAKFVGNITWSDNIPTISQLGLVAYTDDNGIYTLNIPYNGNGENFVLTPSFGTHQFDPATKALFIGDGATVQNNIDFLDKSSFRVQGFVFYDSTTCAVPDVLIKIDGEIAVLDGNPIMTADDGSFDVQVPIGEHHLEMEKAGHTFSIGRFPASGKYNFQEDLAGLDFKDNTKVKIVGRVVGGLREANKIPGLGKSKNNIGVAEIILKSQQGNGCFTDTISTNSQTGEYIVEVPPLKYVPSVRIPSNPTIDFGVLDLVDVSSTPILRTKYDSIFSVTDSSLIRIDSIKFHKQLDYIHRVKPQIIVKGTDGIHDFIGDTTYTYITPDSDTIVRNLRTDPFRWPLLRQKDDKFLYRCLIKVYEEYTNLDDPNSPRIDSVPTTDGKLKFNNELSHIPDVEVALDKVNTPDTLKFLVYSFKPGVPNFAINNSIPDYSFTRRFEINLITSEGEAIPWAPVSNPPTGGDNIYRAYLLGAQSNGEQFVTLGPQVPEYILRDPPGSNSFATRETGTTKTEENTWDWSLGGAAHTQDNIYLGAKFNIGLGVSTATEVKNNNQVGFKAEISGGNGGKQKVVTTNTQSWSTNSGTDQPGKGSDVYIGKSKNVQFGVSEELAIVPDSLCDRIECIGASFGGFRFGKKYGLSVVPGGYQTTFIYNEAHIKNYLIPDLTFLRNALLQSNPKYTNVLPIGHPNYGKNNDDPIFNNDLEGFEVLSGPSYTYEAVNLQDSLSGDSVRFYNIQIDKWHEAIKLNEWEKVHIDDQNVIDSLRQVELDKLEEDNLEMLIAYYALIAANGAGAVTVAYGLISTPVPGTAIAGYATFAVTTATGIAQAELFEEFERYQSEKDRINEKFSQATPVNFSISGGNTYSSSMTHESAATYTRSIEYSMSAEMKLAVEGKVSNTGVGLEKGLELKFSSSRDWSTETAETEQVSYTIHDPDQGDYFSVDVFPSLLGWGPVFKKRAGGATSCPHEDEEVTEFYQPGTVISEATLQRDNPEISASPSILTNIPVDDAAVFNLTLTNSSESNDPRIYNVSLVSSSNPFGAIVTIDGAPPAITVPMPGGNSSSINKVISIEKGPGPVYNYDSLKFIIYAPCQFEAGTSDNVDIVDEVYVSAHFLPTCTDISLSSPEDQWVLNTFANDTMPVAIIDYNINFFDLEDIKFQYKPSNESNWINLETFHKDTTGLNDPEAAQIPTNTPFTLYDWDVSQIVDGYYDVRVVSGCTLADKNSITYSGIMDRINPHPFGNPSPADGILEPNDEISIKFNEPIDLGSLTALNFDIRGVLNGTETDHSTSLYFDGMDDYAEVDGGAALRQRNFTITFAAKRNGTGEQAVISQGADPRERIFVGFNASDQFVFRIGSEEVASTTTYTDDKWRYYTVSYNYENETAELFVIEQGFNGIVNTGNTSIFTDYLGSGKLIFGKNSVTNAEHFQGNLHDVRVWGITLSESENTVYSGKLLSKNEIGLLYNWRIDEADGNLLVENVRRRDANNFGATWTIEPGGNAVRFDGSDDYLKVKAADVAITDNMDFTLEFWFNSTQAGQATLFSNGTASNMQPDSLFSWNISKDVDGKIHVNNYGIDWVAVENDYFDGKWHHFALVLQRTGNLSAYIDGNLQNSTQALAFKQFGGSHVYIGARGYEVTGAETVEQYFNGSMDEFRFWNTARRLEQIRRDKQNRMKADEYGLQLYLPFENYKLDPTGVAILTPSFTEQVDSTNHPVETLNGVALGNQTPTIKLQRPIQEIAFTYSVNNDEIIFTPTTSQELIENVTLDITVKDVKDLQGNIMESPKTWIAYIDKNQVTWQDDLLAFEKETETSLDFSSAIINSGGAPKDFEVLNIPEWLTVSPSSGTIAPNSVMDVDFEVDPLVNIGDYVEDLQLLTDFGYPEKLTIDLKVRDKEPDWKIDPSDYQYSMSIIGLLKIRDIISTDEEDLLAAFVGDEVRGKANVRYIEDLDRYLVFLDVYSNQVSGDAISFKIWDASAGIIYSKVIPEAVQFSESNVIGTLANPQVFETSTKIIVDIPLNDGWNWISHFLLNEDSTNLDVTLESLSANADYLIKSQETYSAYSGGKWVGPLQSDGIRPEKMYKLRTNQIDTLRITGEVIDPRNRTISLANNWNWIGFISIRNQSVKQALGNLNATDGDLIKGSNQFAVYDSILAEWIGSLETMVPGNGYMYRSQGTKSFTYPLAGMFRNEPGAPALFNSEFWPIHRAAYSSNMTAITNIDNSCGIYLNPEEYAIGVFDSESNCRALMSLESEMEEDIHFLTVHGNSIESLQFSLVNLIDGQALDINQELPFVSNQHLGSLQAPYTIELSDQLCTELEQREALKSIRIKAYPTAFTDFVQVDFFADDTYPQASLVLHNAQGQPLFELPIAAVKGYNNYPLQLEQYHLPSGIYFLSLRAGKQMHSTRIIKH